MQPSPHAANQFSWRPAPQPDIVRAVQKDDLYLQQSVDACYDAVMRVFGAVPALQHSKSCKLVATFVYYALTTGAGLQTLGEEYCDLLQLTTQRLQPPPAQQQQQQQQPLPQQQTLPQQPLPVLQGLAPRHTRVLLVLLQSLGPALVDRLVNSLDRAADAGSLPDDLTSFSSWQEYEQAAGASEQQQEQQQQLQHVDALTLVQRLRSLWQRALQRLGPHWPAVRPWLLLLGKLHLAAFYLRGHYYEWSKRLLGVTFTSTSANREQRPSYQVLGVLLLVQLALTAGMQAKPQLEALHGQLGSKQQRRQGQQEWAAQQHAAVLPDWCEYPEPGQAKGGSLVVPAAQPQPQQEDGSLGGHDAGFGLAGGAGRQCPLCLSPRTHPTCTPCGHMFCWHCIAQWCAEKPECPLCRMGVVSPQLVCVYHSDF